VIVLLHILNLKDVVTNGNNVEEKIGKVLHVVEKENVLKYMNGILNVKVVNILITHLLLDVATNGLNVVEKVGKVLLVA